MNKKVLFSFAITALLLSGCNKDYTEVDATRKVQDLGIRATFDSQTDVDNKTYYHYTTDNDGFDFDIIESHESTSFDAITIPITELYENYHYKRFRDLSDAYYYPFQVVDRGELAKIELTAECSTFSEFEQLLETLRTFREHFGQVCQTRDARNFNAPIFATIELLDAYYTSSNHLTDDDIKSMEKSVVKSIYFHSDEKLIATIPVDLKQKYLPEFSYLKLTDDSGHDEITDIVLLEGNNWIPAESFYEFCKLYDIETNGTKDSYTVQIGDSTKQFDYGDSVSFFTIEELTGKRCSQASKSVWGLF